MFPRNSLHEQAVTLEHQLSSSAADAVADEKSLDFYFKSHLAGGGSRTRALLAMRVCEGLTLDPTEGLAIARCIELLHQASLIHDDLQDKDELRRGEKAIWTVAGEATAICLGDNLIGAAFEALSDLEPKHRIGPLIQEVSQTIAAMSAGQALDCRIGCAADWDTYTNIVAAKSGRLLGLPFILPLICIDRSTQRVPQLRAAAAAIGIAYQLADDWIDRDEDKNNRLNGYWILTNTTGATSVAEQYNQQLNIALNCVREHPKAIRHAMHALIEKLNQRFPELCEAA